MKKRSPDKLNRIQEGKNDWDDLADHELNFLQKVAKKTRGIVTLANGVSLAGSVLVINGLYDFVNGQEAAGIVKVGVGRVLDVVDGDLANATGTKGKVGRAIDPFADMVQAGFALPLLAQHDIVPLAAAVTAGGQKVINSIGGVAATLRHREINPTSEGKLGTFALWAGIGCFMLSAVVDRHVPGLVENSLEAAGWLGTVGGAVYQLPATKEYLSVGFGSDQSSPPPEV